MEKTTERDPTNLGSHDKWLLKRKKIECREERVPILNTVVLLASGFTITWIHYRLILIKRTSEIICPLITISNAHVCATLIIVFVIYVVYRAVWSSVMASSWRHCRTFLEHVLITIPAISTSSSYVKLRPSVRLRRLATHPLIHILDCCKKWPD